MTAAFGATEDSHELVIAVAGVAARARATLRVASFAVRPRTPLTAGIGSRAEDAVAHEWAADAEHADDHGGGAVQMAPGPLGLELLEQPLLGLGVGDGRARHRSTSSRR